MFFLFLFLIIFIVIAGVDGDISKIGKLAKLRKIEKTVEMLHKGSLVVNEIRVNSGSLMAVVHVFGVEW